MMEVRKHKNALGIGSKKKLGKPQTK